MAQYKCMACNKEFETPYQNSYARHEQYGLLLRPEQIVANYEAAQQSAQADVLVRCEKCNALIETTVHCDVCGTFEPTRRSRKPLGG